MSTDALVFMIACWSGVLGLAGWSLLRVLRARDRPRPAEPEPRAHGLPEGRS